MVLAGTIFRPRKKSTQDMVTRKEATVALRSRGEAVTISVAAACADMNRSVPDEKDDFALSTTAAPPVLMKLLRLPEFQKEDFRVQQFAIWTITDNPKPGGYVRIGAFGVGSGPDKEELQRIRDLFKKAGISAGYYPALKDIR
jgi:hypothetical protein